MRISSDKKATSDEEAAFLLKINNKSEFYQKIITEPVLSLSPFASATSTL